MNHSPEYHTLHVFNEGRFVMALDYDDRGEAVRESVAFQEDGFDTELLTLSHADVFDTAPTDYDPESTRIAY